MFLPSLGDLSGIHPGCLEDETSRLGQALALELGDFLGNFVLVLLHVFFADHPGAGHGLYVVDNREILAVIRSRIGCRVEQLPAQVRGAFLAGKIVLVLIVGDEAPEVVLHVGDDGLVDVAAERPRLQKALAEAEQLLARSEAKLANRNFTEKAPADVVAGEQGKVVEFSARIEKLRTQLEELG